jgi:hypothetical protein
MKITYDAAVDGLRKVLGDHQVDVRNEDQCNSPAAQACAAIAVQA